MALTLTTSPVCTTCVLLIADSRSNYFRVPSAALPSRCCVDAFLVGTASTDPPWRACFQPTRRPDGGCGYGPIEHPHQVWENMLLLVDRGLIP